VSNAAVSGNLGVDVAALALIQVDLGLQDVDLFSLHLQLLSEMLFQVLHLLLLCVVVIREDSLVG